MTRRGSHERWPKLDYSQIQVSEDRSPKCSLGRVLRGPGSSPRVGQQSLGGRDGPGPGNRVRGAESDSGVLRRDAGRRHGLGVWCGGDTEGRKGGRQGRRCWALSEPLQLPGGLYL